MAVRSSSVSLPHFSLTVPLTCFQFPSTRFQSMTFSFSNFSGCEAKERIAAAKTTRLKLSNGDKVPPTADNVSNQMFPLVMRIGFTTSQSLLLKLTSKAPDQFGAFFLRLRQHTGVWTHMC